jgi:hypothetical protein
MSGTFLGFPLSTWALVSLAAAVFYFIKWPRPKADWHGPSRLAFVHFVLRWFHSAVWVLLGLACFLWVGGPSGLASVLALAALVVYLIFLVTLIADRRHSPPP